MPTRASYRATGDKDSSGISEKSYENVSLRQSDAREEHASGRQLKFDSKIEWQEQFVRLRS